MKVIIILLFIGLAANRVLAQTDPSPDYLELIQNGSESEETDFQLFADQLERFKNHPLPLNTATSHQLGALPLLNAIQVSALLNYRQQFGQLTDWEEMTRIPGFSAELIEQLKPYCTLQTMVTVNDWRKEFKEKGKFEQTLRFSSLLTNQKGYQTTGNNKAYLGNRLKLYTRTRFSVPGKFSAMMLTEKDPGEKMQPTPDFISGHLFSNIDGKYLKSVVLGDYTFSAGTGLVFSPGFGVFKSAQTLQVYHGSQGIRPYTSVNESGFYRGGAITLGHKAVTATWLISDKPIDATLTTDSSGFSSIYNNGLHRTSNEIARRKIAREQLSGINVAYRTNKLELSLNGLYCQISNSVIAKQTPEAVAGIFSRYQFSRGIIFTELAQSKTQQFAGLVGLITTLSPKVSTSLVYRSYSNHFNNPYGGSFSHSGRLNNEEGTYLGIEYQASSRWKYAVYLDQYQYRFPNFYSQFPAKQRDGLVQITYTRKKRFTVYSRVRMQQVQRDNKTNEKLIHSYQENRVNFRLHSEIIVSPRFSLKNRLEWVDRNSAATKPGFMIFQDFTLKEIIKNINLSGRLAYFDVAAYTDRIYAFENDMPYSFSVPAHQGTGTRFYLLINANISKKLESWLRVGSWLYSNTETIGSGNETINGRSKPQLSIQFRYLIN